MQRACVEFLFPNCSLFNIDMYIIFDNCLNVATSGKKPNSPAMSQTRPGVGVLHNNNLDCEY